MPTSGQRGRRGPKRGLGPVRNASGAESMGQCKGHCSKFHIRWVEQAHRTVEEVEKLVQCVVCGTSATQ